MKYIPRPNTSIVKPEPEPGTVQDLDIEDLLAKGGEVLRREITNLLIESSSKKLSAGSARDLVAYVRLLSDLKTEKQKELADLSDDELKAIL